MLPVEVTALSALSFGSVGGNTTGLGAVLHNAGYRACGLVAEYVEIAAPTLEGALAEAAHRNLDGFAVSMPFKEAIVPRLRSLDETASRVGAVNTVRVVGRDLVGYNTDVSGALAALDEAKVQFVGRALVVGAGGAGRAIAYGLRCRGWEVFIASRTQERARRAEHDLVLSGTVAIGSQDTVEAALLVNATPDASESSPLTIEVHRAARWVLDVTIDGAGTSLQDRARRRGLIFVSGYAMLLHQAAFQFRMWTGHAAPTDAMRGALMSALGEPGALSALAQSGDAN